MRSRLRPVSAPVTRGGGLSPREFSINRYTNLENITIAMKFEQRQRRVGKGKWDRASALSKKKGGESSRSFNIRRKKEESSRHALPGMNLQFGDMRFRSMSAGVALPKTKRKSSTSEALESKIAEANMHYKFNAQRVKERQLNDKRQSLRKKLGRLRLQESEIKSEVQEKQTQYEFMVKELKKLHTEERGMTEYKDDMLQKCRDVVAKAENWIDMQLECEQYAKTLRRMERRLWEQQITFKRTMSSYKQALKLQKFECSDLEREAKFAENQRKSAANAFNGLLKRQESRLHSFRDTLIALKENKAERDALMAEYNDLIYQEQSREKATNDVSVKKNVMKMINAGIAVNRVKGINAQVRSHQYAFRKIMLVTGLTRVDEMLEKFHNREKDAKVLDDRVEALKKQLNQRAARIKELERDLQKAKIEANSGTKCKQEFIDQLSTKLDSNTRVLQSMRKTQHRSHIEQYSFNQALNNLNLRLTNVRLTPESKLHVGPREHKKYDTFDIELERLPLDEKLMEKTTGGSPRSKSDKSGVGDQRSIADSKSDKKLRRDSSVSGGRSIISERTSISEKGAPKVTLELPKELADKMTFLQMRLRTLLNFYHSEPIMKLADTLEKTHSNFDPEVVSLQQRPADKKVAPQRVSSGDSAAYVKALVQHVPQLPRHNTRVKNTHKDQESNKYEKHRNLSPDEDELYFQSDEEAEIMEQSKLMEMTAIKRKALREHKTVEEVIASTRHLLKQQTIVMDRNALKNEAKMIHKKATRPVKEKKGGKTRSVAQPMRTQPIKKAVLQRTLSQVQIKSKSESTLPKANSNRPRRYSLSRRGRNTNRTRISRTTRGKW